ncbi:MAG: transglutaminase domain-containing protein [Bacteroidota bacterium]
MNKGVFFSILCCSLIFSAFPQSVPDFRRSDAIAKAVPDSVEISIKTLSDYFLANLFTQKELIRAYYYWTANEIVYDVDNMFTFRSSDNPASLIIETLRERKAVCQGYAALFHELCENAGIESYVVLGYTKQNGIVINVNHAWVVARIDTGWYFFDPTWASGYIMNGKFNQKFTNEYYMVKPAVFIKTHMSFDPLWQCLYYPYSAQQFSQGNPVRKEDKNFFNFRDSISAYNRLTKPEKEVASLRRLENNGVVNNSLADYQRYLKQGVEVDRINRQTEIQNKLVKEFNQAIYHYNAATFLFNDFINYWNRQFQPVRPDMKIRQMLDTCDYHLGICQNILSEIEPQEETLRQNMAMLTQPAADLRRNIDKQKEFLRDYFATPKALRPKLFGKYSSTH